jgi:hypothetical protein
MIASSSGRRRDKEPIREYHQDRFGRSGELFRQIKKNSSAIVMRLGKDMPKDKPRKE